MNAQTKVEAPALQKLREPFPDHQISKLPKETKAQREAREKDRNLIVWNCPECGGYHHKNAVHLDYVGHAALTDRLLDTDIEWSWEPLAYTPEGLPALDRTGGLWIKLTVQGVTRLGYGAADGKSGGDAVKEMIGDALRNAAMRFGAALDLWHKGVLHLGDGGEEQHDPATGEVIRNGPIADDQFALLVTTMELKGVTAQRFCKRYSIDSVKDLPASKFQEALNALNELPLKQKEPA